MAAIQLACTSLWAGDCDTAVAGGLNVMTNSDIFSGLSRGQFLSKTANCQTFDNDADGYCRGDGIGTLVIKRLEDAEADNDRILGVILETATNHSANAVSITHPHAPTQEDLFKKVMDSSGVDPHDVSYVEMHGTGTQAGDGTEMTSVTNVFAPSSRKGQRTKPLHLGSVKSNVGHGEAVSGVTAMIKCLLMMQKNLIPPHCGIKKTINQSFPTDLNARNVHIAFKSTPLKTPDNSPRKIFVNNFSAAGGNTAMLLEDAPTKPYARDDPRSNFVVTVSAKSKTALRANTRNLIQFIDNNSNVPLADLSYTTTARRIQHNYRIAFGCNSIAKAKEVLASKLDDAIDPVPNVQPSIAFTFTGQGSHYAALGKQLFENSSQFQSDLLGFDSIGFSQGFPSFMPLLEGEVEVKTLSPVVVQLGLCCIQMALTRLWASWGVKPSVVLGHSLGEYAALNAAGVISPSDAIYLVGERARLLQDKCSASSHAMLATNTSAQTAKGYVAGIAGIEVACMNARQETVLSGAFSDIDKAAELLTAEGIKSTKLNVQYAFHSSQVDPILDEFTRLASSVVFHKPTVPIISPLLSTVLCEVDNIDANYLARHAREAVNFVGGIASAQQLGLINDMTVWVEIGPHPVCLGFVKSELGQSTVTAPSLRRNEAPYKILSNSLSVLHTAGISIDWNEYHRDFLDCVQMLDLPAYAFDNKNYWIQYTGDWNLSKGQTGGLAIMPEVVKSTLSTTTVHKVISESVENDTGTVVVESDIGRPDLCTAVSGHLVNGTALCPSSIYGDMALTVCDYLHKLLRPESTSVGMNVRHMEVFKPLIGKGIGEEQMVRLSAKADLSKSRADLVFSSGTGKSEIEHARCHVEYGSNSVWLAEWQRTAYLIKGRIDGLQKAASTGAAHRMLRGMAYKLFGALVDYDSRYRGMEEVILDSPQLEATSHVVFQTTEADGSFFCSPYWIDSVAHLAGFTVNANDALDSTKQVYISHGWESMRFAEPLSASKTYRSYVKMQPAEDSSVVSGDVYIFDGDRIIAMVGALKFQCIPRQLLNTFLPPKGPAVQKAPTAFNPRPALKTAAPKVVKPVATRMNAAPRAGPPVTTKALDIIADELGVPSTELANAIEFAAMGVDSLMSLSITGRMREELEIEVSSSLFIDHPTVGSMKGFLSQYGSTDMAVADLDDSEDSSAAFGDSDSASSEGDSYSTPTSPGSPASPSEADPLSQIIRQTISTEMGVEVEELLAARDLSELGMDSLMALSILGVLRETTGMSLPATFLVDNSSIKAIEKTLNIDQVQEVKKTQPIPKVVEFKMPPKKAASRSEKVAPAPKEAATPERFASSVLLQGSPRTAEKTFWLVPDGSGSATSYIFMPDISRKVAVWGLNSPYMKTPEEYHCGVKGMATKFIQEIKRRQPQGPYNIGGWSAGGVISFETARQLIEAGDTVDVLALIDTPCPLIIEPLPSSLHRFFGSIGLLGEGDGAIDRLPPWLLPHFAASVQALSTYDAKRINPAKCPKVYAIWCEDGVCKFPGDPRPDPYPYGHAQWLLENRTDFGPNLWDEYLDKDKIICRQMEGNHFNMMRDPYVTKLSDFLREALL
jgi:iterative type I PKS product template protein